MIPSYTPAQQDWLMIAGLTLVFLAAFVMVYRIGEAMAARTTPSLAAGVTLGMIALAVAVTAGLVRLVGWPVRARRRQLERLWREADEDAAYLIRGYRAVSAVRL